jgi:hypothetical protein
MQTCLTTSGLSQRSGGSCIIVTAGLLKDIAVVLSARLILQVHSRTCVYVQHITVNTLTLSMTRELPPLLGVLEMGLRGC